MNLPNLITLFRIPALFVIVAFLYMPWRWTSTIAFVLFLIAAFSDWLDGYIARKYDITSTMGKFIDALTDKILSVGLFVTLLALGLLPEWAIFFVLLIILREFIITGLRLIAMSKGHILAAESAGKFKTGLQLVSLGFLLSHHAFWNDWGYETMHSKVLFYLLYIYYLIGILSFVLAALFTAYSGYWYLKKHWHLLAEE